MDWNPLHSSLFTGAGTPWSPLDSRPSWAIDPKLYGFSINLDPRYSDFFKEVQLPAIETLGVAAAVVTGAYLAAPVIGAASTAAGLGMSSAAILGTATGAGLAAGAGAGIAFNWAEGQLGVTKGTGTFALNADKIGLILGGGWLAANPPGSPTNPQATYKETEKVGAQILATTMAPKPAAPKPTPTPYAGVYGPPSYGVAGTIGPAPASSSKGALLLGFAALLAVAA